LSEQPKFPPVLVLIFGILAASTAAIFIRLAQQYAPSLVIAALRLTFATLIIAPFAIVRQGKEIRSLNQRQRGLILLSGFFLALHFASWITSLEYTTVASSVVLVTSTPLWVALLLPLTLKEPMERVAIIGMVIAMVGAIIVGLSDSCQWNSGRLTCPPFTAFIQGKAFLGDILALTGAIMAAFYIIIGRKLRPSVSLLSYIFGVYGSAAGFLILLVFVSGEKLTGFPVQAYGWSFMLALFPQILGHSSFNWALRYMSAGYVSITLLGEPISSTILAMIFLDETPGWIKVVGSVLILIGIALASLSELKKKS
jgi:drug/metabolite transporter (DMT)-like permease